MKSKALQMFAMAEEALFAMGFTPLENVWLWRAPLGWIRVEFIGGVYPCIRGTWTDGRTRDITFFDLDDCCLPDDLLAWAGGYARGLSQPRRLGSDSTAAQGRTSSG